MRKIDRIAVVVKPKQPFLNWLNHTSELDFSSPVTMEELHTDCDVLLLPETDSQPDLGELLETIKPDLFAMQLEEWLQNPGAWPPERSAKAFDEWFSLEIYPMVLDLVSQPIVREGADDLDEAAAQDLRIAEVMATGDEAEDDELKVLLAWQTHLEEKLTFPFEAKIGEYGEHRQIKAGAQATVINFAGVDNQYGILVSLKMHGKRFDFPLYNLEVMDQASLNYQLVNDYAVWFVNQ